MRACVCCRDIAAECSWTVMSFCGQSTDNQDHFSGSGLRQTSTYSRSTIIDRTSSESSIQDGVCKCCGEERTGRRRQRVRFSSASDVRSPPPPPPPCVWTRLRSREISVYEVNGRFVRSPCAECVSYELLLTAVVDSKPQMRFHCRVFGRNHGVSSTIQTKIN